MRLHLPGHRRHIIRYYCKKCFEENFNKCEDCGAPIKWKSDYHVLPSGDVICNDCFENNYETCYHCGDIIENDHATFIDYEAYCRLCVDRYFVMCHQCGDYVRSEGAHELHSYWYCDDCYGNIDDNNEDEDEESWEDEAPIYLATNEVSTDDVIKLFPDIENRLSRIFDRSAWNRSINARYALQNLRQILPKIKINDDFTYINLIGIVKPLSDLKSPKNSVFKALQQDIQRQVARQIDAINNVMSDIGRLMNEKKTAYRYMIEAVKVRIYLDKHNPNEGAATRAIEGRYPYPDACHPRLMFIITKDPVAIIAKTTSQCWESMSCEKVVRGEYGQGAFSDIANSNAVCYIFDKTLPIARIMIRWCETSTRKSGTTYTRTIDLGIEEKWYFCTKHPKKAGSFDEMGTSTYKDSSSIFLDRITARDATSFLISILKSKGFYNDYDSCKTPYRYMGYSDSAGSGKTTIKYEQ